MDPTADIPAEGNESGRGLGTVQWLLSQGKEELCDVTSPALTFAVQTANDDGVQL